MSTYFRLQICENCRAYFLVSVRHTTQCQTVQFLLRQTVRFSQAKEVQSYVRAARAHARFILRGHLRGAADGETPARRAGPVRARRDHSRIRSGGRAHAGFRHSAAFRSGADCHARRARGVAQLRRTQKPFFPPSAERSAGHHHPQGTARYLQAAATAADDRRGGRSAPQAERRTGPT